MVRMVIDIHEDGDLLACKETVAMLLEPLGRVRGAGGRQVTCWWAIGEAGVQKPYWRGLLC